MHAESPRAIVEVVANAEGGVRRIFRRQRRHTRSAPEVVADSQPSPGGWVSGHWRQGYLSRRSSALARSRSTCLRTISGFSSGISSGFAVVSLSA
jgi:hypothetical protein